MDGSARRRGGFSAVAAGFSTARRYGCPETPAGVGHARGTTIASSLLQGETGMSTIHEFLSEAHVPYTVVPHRPAFTAQEEAAAAHVPGRDWAKVVVCFI